MIMSDTPDSNRRNCITLLTILFPVSKILSARETVCTGSLVFNDLKGSLTVEWRLSRNH